MAKLYFNYSSMNAGKSTILLQAAHNYNERGMDTMLLTADFDDRAGAGKIGSRIGLEADADTYSADSDLFEMVRARNAETKLACVLVDEVNFMQAEQVWQLAKVVDELKIPVMCYGLRTDFQGKLFPASAELLAIADNLREIRTICWCGRKATMVMRLDSDGNPVTEGDQISVGGNESYVSLCRKHWLKKQLSGCSD